MPVDSAFNAEWWEIGGSRYIRFKNRFHDTSRVGKNPRHRDESTKPVKSEFHAHRPPSVAGKGK